MRKMQYICAPLTNGKGLVVEHNMTRVHALVKKVMKENEEQYLPNERPFIFVPHYALQRIGFDPNTGKEVDRDYAMAFCLHMVGVCHEIIVMDGEITSGMGQEVREAHRLNKKVRVVTL